MSSFGVFGEYCTFDKNDVLRFVRVIGGFVIIFSALSCEEVHDSVLELANEEVAADDEKVSEYPDLYYLILKKDSLLFQVGFNQIDTHQVALLISEDFEFYHDEHGVTDSKEVFVSSISGLSELPFKTWRVLRKESMEVFPLYGENKSKLYGVIQTGKHEFYQQVEGEEARMTSVAQFNHLWILENDDWKLKRVLSYDHRNSE